MAEKNKNLKKALLEEIEISNGINVEIKKSKVIMKKGNNQIERSVNPRLIVKVENNKVIISSKKTSRKEKKVFGSLVAHIKNSLNGLNEPYTYRLQAVSVHFPMTLFHDKTSNELVVKNFLGERKDRRMKLVEGVNVRINKDIIEIESYNIEKAGQTAANIEKATKIRFRDRRIFQDGIFIIEKPGRSFL
ncbi:MAG: 50S ribosomal protein L6 [Nanoarchaeota archaeon]|nr:50S ribosomal protein L6 [Nanoarchaeota archaeon]